MSDLDQLVLDETLLSARSCEDLRRYILQRSLTVHELKPPAENVRRVRGGKIHRGRAVVRGLECETKVYLSDDQSLFVLCASPTVPWTFGDCFPEIPHEESLKQFFFGQVPSGFKAPLISKVGLADSVWVLISAADEMLIESKGPKILVQLGFEGTKNPKLVAGLNMFGTPSFGGLSDLLQDEVLKTILPGREISVQANVEYRGGAPVLSLPIPLVKDRNKISLGPCELTDVELSLSTPMYYVRRAPDLRLSAKLKLDSATLEFTADYPLDDDIVEAQIKVEAGKRLPFLDETPDLPDLTSPDIEITVGVSLSKSEKALKKAYFDVMVHKSWTIVPDVLEVGNPEFHFIVFDPANKETRHIVARVAGEIKIADSTLRISGHYGKSGSYSDGQFFVLLDPVVPLSLSNLIQKLHGKDFDSDSLPKNLHSYALNNLHFECDLTGHIFMETSVSVPWKIDLTDSVNLEFKQLHFLFEKLGKSKRFRACADLELGGVRFSLSGDYQTGGGWTFAGSTYPGDKITIGKFAETLANKLQTSDTPPESLSDIVLQDIAFSFNTKDKELSFTIKTTFPVDDKNFAAVVTINKKNKKSDKSLKFGGTINVGDAQFTLDFTSATGKKALTATWDNKSDSAPLNLGAIGGDLPDLTDLEEMLMPVNATLKLISDGKKKTLSLTCKNHNGAQAAFLIVNDPDAKPPTKFAALGLKPSKISTEDLGALGSSLKPHNIALNKLVIVAASADAPVGTKLFDDQDDTISKGLLLRGALEFEETSFSYPFECRLGGDKPKELSKKLAGAEASVAPAGSPPATDAPASQAGKKPQSEEGKNEEGKNNVSVGRKIGPVTFHKARLESRDKRVYVLLDASLGSGGFELDLIGFNVNFPLSLLKDPSSNVKEIEVGLEGLSIEYSKPPLSISGGFARTNGKAPYVGDLYQGNLLIKAATFQVTALGSYGTIQIGGEKKPSLFIYGMYAGVLGGPPMFFVTGLALGGGYNTRLVIPPIEKVAEFPLITAVMDPDSFSINSLRDVVNPSYGDYWLAVGVKFSSFKMADSFALLTVSFGNRLQFALLGLTKLSMPPDAKPEASAIYVELALRAVLDIDGGVFSIEGRLTDNSFVLTKDIRLTGGFAFFTWFGNATNAGDFVISLGGYHPNFVRPQHYPVVPRMGIRGKIGPLSITGEAYFALTPSCVMAGQKFEAVFSTSIVTAAFVSYADFLVAWAPFHYDARIGIGIAVSVRIIRTIKLEISASLHVWGPPFAGTAHVTVLIISFTIEFGDHSGAKPPPLTWDEFRKGFLPAPKDQETSAIPQVATARITEGLVREVKKTQDKQEETFRVVNPHELMIETESVVPCSEVTVGEKTTTGTAPIGIRPMGKRLTSHHKVKITAHKRNGRKADVTDKFVPVQWPNKNYPEALWSPVPGSGKPEAGMVKDVPSGVVLRVQPKTPQHQLGPFPIEKFKYELIHKSIPRVDQNIPTSGNEEFTNVDKGSELRRQIRDCLANHVARPGQFGWNEIAMKNTSADSGDHFKALPMCAALGESLGRLT